MNRQIKVLHVVASTRRRGAETFAAELARALDQMRVLQHVAVLHAETSASPDYSVDSTVVARGNRLVPGIRVHAGGIRHLRQLIGSMRPDVIQTHGGEAFKHAVTATLAARMPIVYRKIGTAPPWIQSGARRAAYGWLMRRATKIIAVAEAVRLETIALFRIPHSRVLTIPNAVDPRRMNPVKTRLETRKELNVDLDAPVVVSLGALTWEKDPFVHIEVTERAAREFPHLVHIFAGGGPLRAPLEEDIGRRKLTKQIRLLGDRGDVADLLAASDVMLFASRREGMEGMPASLIEAGIAGLPVAGFAVSGAAEVVVDGETGLLVDPADVAGLATALVKLLSDEKWRMTLGRAASSHCRTRFDIASVAPRYLEVYKEVAATS